MCPAYTKSFYVYYIVHPSQNNSEEEISTPSFKKETDLQEVSVTHQVTQLRCLERRLKQSVGCKSTVSTPK